jgi:hypothetical protein
VPENFLDHLGLMLLDEGDDPRCAAQAIEDFLADRLERRPPATA